MSNYSQRAVFECTALKGTNKVGNLKADADGYYNNVVLGALNVFNSRGQFYTLDGARHLFEASSAFMRRVNAGSLYGENGHPRQGNLSNREFMNRVMDIYEPNIAHHIRRVHLDSGSVKDSKGKVIVSIMGEVKPTGAAGHSLKEGLENRHQNVCFSIRSLTQDDMVGGIVQKSLQTIITFDTVVEPGIATATKWKNPSLESYAEVPFTSDDLREMAEEQSAASVAAMESHGGIGAKQLIEMLGWNNTSKGGIVLPPSAAW
jgi:hypothetical protein